MWKSFIAVAILFLTLPSVPVSGVTSVIRTINDGNLTMFFHNNGTFGYDPNATRGEVTGLYYPRDSYNGVLAGGGVWIAGKRDGKWRITISGDSSEFVPGLIGNDGFPADTSFRIYKITRGEDYAQNDDYRNWPVGLGAPADAFGRPQTRGSQSLFTIFNDSDSAAHVFRGFAGTPPLGVQAKLSVHTWDADYQLADTMLTQVIFLEYAISNQFESSIESCVVALYADVDIGYSATDRFGSSEELRAAYVYDEADYDPFYGPQPPVVGIVSLDDAITSANFYYPCSRQFPECIRVDTLPELINLVHGLRANGTDHIDSVTLLPTRFPYGGNPADSSGSICNLSRDYRILLNTAPIALEPGAVHNVKAALIVASGISNLDGVKQFLATARMLREFYSSDSLKPGIRVSPVNAVEVKGKRLLGRSWGGRYLSGGVDVAAQYLSFAGIPETPVGAELRIGYDRTQALDRFVESEGEWRYAGKSTMEYPIAANMNSQEGRTLFLDLNDDGNPVGDDGKLEPLIVTSLYAQSAGFGSGGARLADFAGHLLYAVELDQNPLEVGPSRLLLEGARMNDTYMALTDFVTFMEPRSGAPTERVFEITNSTDFVQTIDLTSNAQGLIGFQPSVLELGIGERRYVSGYSTAPPLLDHPYLLNISGCGFAVDTLSLPIRVSRTSVTVPGDADDSGRLDLVDLLNMVRILYRGDPILVPIRQIDSDCDYRFNLVDLIAFINQLYLHAPLPCDAIHS